MSVHRGPWGLRVQPHSDTDDKLKVIPIADTSHISNTSQITRHQLPEVFHLANLSFVFSNLWFIQGHNP